MGYTTKINFVVRAKATHKHPPLLIHLRKERLTISRSQHSVTWSQVDVFPHQATDDENNQQVDGRVHRFFEIRRCRIENVR